MANDFIKLIPRDNPKDRIEVEVGDSKQPEFIPQVKLMRWDNEVNFSVRHIDDEGDGVYYDVEDGYEFEVVFNQKPKRNVVRFSLNSKELDFFYQPELTQEEIDRGAYRPENVVGSYAVYHKTKGGMNRSDGMEYKAGKAFHIYRPQIFDANGDWVWGELDINGANLTITIDQTWLDNAAYPVTLDPTFGYTSVGVSSQSIAAEGTGSLNRSTMYGAAYSLAEAGDLTQVSISLAVTNTPDSGDIFVGVYSEDSAGSGSHDLVDSDEELNKSLTSTDQFYDFTGFSASLTAGNYILAGLGNGEDFHNGSFQQARMRWDTAEPARNIYSETTSAVGSYNTRKSEDPWTEVAASGNTQVSIYATYTASASNPEPSASDDVTLSESTSTLINNLTPSTSDSITLSESTSVLVNAPITPEIDANDSITVSESSTITLNSESQASSSESVAVSESSTVEIYNYVIYDTFTGSNNADVTGRTPDTVNNGNTWFDIARTGFPGSSGGGTIQGNQLQLGNDYGGQAIDAEAADVIIKVDWTPGVSSLNRNDVVFRWSSNDDYWVFLTREDNNDALLIWYGGGSGGTTDSTSYTFNEGTTYQLMVVLNGDDISCYVDGQLLLSGNSSTHNTNTKHGLLRETSSSASRYDNFAILTAPSAGEPLKINIAGYTGVRVF